MTYMNESGAAMFVDLAVETPGEGVSEEQRLAMLGRMAGWLAHEVRNAMAPLLLDVDVLERLLREDGAPDPALEVVGELRHSVCQLERIVRVMLGFGRAPLAASPVNLNGVVLDALAMLRPQLRDVAPVVSMLEATRTVRGDPTLLWQVVVNLVKNAAEAVADEPAPLALMVHTHDSGEDVLLEVIDSGMGMTEVQVARALGSSFTTKAAGTGMGLVICRRIIESHGGRMDIRSRVGDGTRVVVRLPAVTHGDPSRSWRGG
jgi:signal transduction histidine kinase